MPCSIWLLSISPTLFELLCWLPCSHHAVPRCKSETQITFIRFTFIISKHIKMFFSLILIAIFNLYFLISFFHLCLLFEMNNLVIVILIYIYNEKFLDTFASECRLIIFLNFYLQIFKNMIFKTICICNFCCLFNQIYLKKSLLNVV